jgi:hypothetical protein
MRRAAACNWWARRSTTARPAAAEAASIKVAVSNSLWSGSVAPTNVALASQSYTPVTVVVAVPTNAANGSTNIALLRAVSQAASNRMALAVDSTSIGTNTGGGTARYV